MGWAAAIESGGRRGGTINMFLKIGWNSIATLSLAVILANLVS